MLLLLGAALTVALAVQLWRTIELEAATRRLELDKAEALGERILRQAVASDAVFAAANGLRAVLRDDDVVIDGDAVGWLDQAPPAADDDLVVDDRLTRAARAEFADGDAAAAARAFDELLAGPLRDAQRLRVLAAAAWQSRRAGAGERLAGFTAALGDRLAVLRPADFARPVIAAGAAAAVRLCAGAAAQPEWLPGVVALLPRSVAAGLPELPELAGFRATTVRRDRLLALRTSWRAMVERPANGIAVGPDRHLLWWRGRAGSRDVDVCCLPPGDLIAAVRAAGAAGTLPEWPWLVEPEFGAETAVFAGVPFVCGLVPTAASAADQQRWLLPALTLVLLAAFGVATAQHLRASRREAAAVRAQAEFLTTVTHELRTPLASIRLLGEMLAEGRAKGREDDYYRMLAGEAGRLSMLIENVLDLGRLERGERAYDLRPCDVGEVVRETVALVEPVALRDAASIAIDAPGEPCEARIDRAALTQALISVLDNARKYGGGGTITVTLRATGACLRLAVRDHGPGVPPAERERIFDRFVRGSAHAHGSQPGVGIGLYLARLIARRLGGDLTCTEPADGGPGAQFTFDLPMHDHSEPTA